MGKPRHALAVLALGSGLVVGLGGCGYALGYRKDPTLACIAVPTFTNATFPLRREVEYELTSAVRKEIQARTPWRLVASADADLVVFGRILEFDELVIAEGRRDEKTESNLRVTVELRAEDYRHLRTWTQQVRDVEPFSIESGETIAVARRRAIGNLAEKIVLALEAW